MWFKRDLRFTDHEPLFTAQQKSIPILLIYCFEPSLMSNDDSDVRHWRFVYQSLLDMQEKLKGINAYFEQQLIDYDVCSNWGNWAYLAGVGNDPRGNRYFNIEKQANDYDKNKTFRNLWLK